MYYLLLMFNFNCQSTRLMFCTLKCLMVDSVSRKRLKAILKSRFKPPCAFFIDRLKVKIPVVFMFVHLLCPDFSFLVHLLCVSLFGNLFYAINKVSHCIIRVFSFCATEDIF